MSQFGYENCKSALLGLSAPTGLLTLMIESSNRGHARQYIGRARWKRRIAMRIHITLQVYQQRLW